MSWMYEIVSGKLYSENGELVGVGYSGAGDHKNNPEFQSVSDKGPIPSGSYQITAPVYTVTHGPYVLPLVPAPANIMYGRSGFLIHGDSKVAPGTGSEGCIILSRDVRQRIWESSDHDLDVVSSVPTELLRT